MTATSFTLDFLHFQPKQLSKLLTVVALALWAISLLQSKLILDDWGIIHSYSFSYFLAIGTLTIASAILWRSKETHHILLCFQLCLFIAMLWLTPMIFGATLVSTRYEFGYYSNTQYIVNFGHLNTATQWTHSWPSLPILGTILVEILGLKSVDTSLIWLPLLLQFIMIIPLFVLLSTFTGRNNKIWAAIWIIYLFNHTGQFYFSHQTLALFVVWTLLALMVGYPEWAKSKTIKYAIVVVILMTFLAMTHLLSSMLFLSIIISLWIIKRKVNFTLILFFSATVIAWSMYSAIGFFNYYAPDVVGRLFRIDILWSFNVSQRMNLGTAAHMMVADIRVYITLLIGAIGFLGVIFSHKFKSVNDITALIIIGGILVALPFGFYQGEMISRVFLFLLPLLAYFSTKLLNTRVSLFILTILLICLIPLSIISIHGNQAVDQITTSQRDYWHFLEDNTSEGHFTGGGMAMSWSLGYLGTQTYDPGLNVQESASWLQWIDELSTGKWPGDGNKAYIALTSYEEADYNIFKNAPNVVPELRSWLSNSFEYNLIFKSGDVTGYMHD